ncbi:MAG: accessory gene regulator B family protein [Bacilli bacterium]
MKHKFINWSINTITKYKDYSEKDIARLKYGLEGLYLTITKMIIILMVALLLGIFKELIILLILFNIIRFPAFGFHANKSITCLIFSIILVIGLPVLFMNINIHIIAKIIICIISLISFILYAPADTVKRPLTNKKKRIIRKTASIIVAIIYIILVFTIKSKYITDLILSALIIETILINPLTYKAFNMPYRNYLKVK